MLKNILMEKVDISDEQLIVFPLVKKDADLTKLKFINFGLKIHMSLSSFVLNLNLWPKDITVKPFKFSKRTECCALTDSNNISICYQNVGGLRSILSEFFIAVSQEEYPVITLT